MFQYRNQLIRFGLGLGAVLGVAQAANASYIVSSAGIDPAAGSLNGTLHAPSLTVDAGIGRLQLTGKTDTGTAFTFESFCVDIAHSLTTGTFAASPLSTLSLSSLKYDQLTSLLYNVDSYIGTNLSGTGSTAERSAAAQIAIWEIVNETGAYNATSGSFFVNNVSRYDNLTATALSDAATLLANVSDGTTWTKAKVSADFKVALLTSAGNQTQILYGPEATSVLPVPEPATWGMMVLGFGVMGFALRRNRVKFDFA